MNKRAIDISDIEKRYNSIQKNINYDDVRIRIKKVLATITDKDNNKARASQETIGKYLFPHLGADSSTQSTMSRFVNGNKNAKGDSCPDINALGKLSQLTGIPLNWFLYGDSNENTTNSDTIKAHDLYRMLFIDLPTKYGVKLELTKIATHIDYLPDYYHPQKTHRLFFNEKPYLLLKLPLFYELTDSPPFDTKAFYSIDSDFFSYDLLNLAKKVIPAQELSDPTSGNEDNIEFFINGVTPMIKTQKNQSLQLTKGMLSYTPF